MKRDMTDDELNSAIEKARIELVKAEIAKDEAALSLKKLWHEYEVRNLNNSVTPYRYAPAGGPRGE